MLRIGTINLNGETWNLNQKLPRISKKIIDPQKVKEQMTDVVKIQLGKILESERYDILAIQELVYFKPFFSEIKSAIERKGYKLITPESLGEYTHFTTAFIVKNKIEESIIKSNFFSETNRFMTRNIKTQDNQIITLFNIHINTWNEEIESVREDVVYNILNESKVSKFIILGDFNAYTKEQDTSKKPVASKSDIIYKLRDKYNLIECGKDTDYTYVSSNFKRKLDHIFISNGIKELKEYETINNNVNFTINPDDGFTDHSMLSIEIEYDI